MTFLKSVDRKHRISSSAFAAESLAKMPICLLRLDEFLYSLGWFFCSDRKLFSDLHRGLFLWRLKAEGLHVL